jgi:hypothetical protein
VAKPFWEAIFLSVAGEVPLNEHSNILLFWRLGGVQSIVEYISSQLLQREFPSDLIYSVIFLDYNSLIIRIRIVFKEGSEYVVHCRIFHCLLEIISNVQSQRLVVIFIN